MTNREIDKEIAEFMGWHFLVLPKPNNSDFYMVCSDLHNPFGTQKHPTKLIQDAFMVVEKMRDVFILKKLATGQYIATIYTQNGEYRGVDDKSAPMAISKATLKYIETIK